MKYIFLFLCAVSFFEMNGMNDQDMEKYLDELNQSCFLLQSDAIKQLRNKPNPDKVQCFFIEKDYDLAAKVSEVNHILDNTILHNNQVSDIMAEFVVMPENFEK